MGVDQMPNYTEPMGVDQMPNYTEPMGVDQMPNYKSRDSSEIGNSFTGKKFSFLISTYNPYRSENICLLTKFHIDLLYEKKNHA